MNDNFINRKVNLMFVFTEVVWIFFFNKYMIQNPVVLCIILSIVYAIVLWANFFVKLFMSKYAPEKPPFKNKID